jgi:ABC-type protease/lipase transport system fused ATPase/permease subunit
MSTLGPFDRETTLDLVVNAIPLAIMLFFIGLFLFVNPFGSDPVATVIQLTIVVVTFVALGILTYVSGKAISDSEEELERMNAEKVSEAVGATDPAAELEAGEEEMVVADEADLGGPDAADTDEEPDVDGDADEDVGEKTDAENAGAD